LRERASQSQAYGSSPEQEGLEMEIDPAILAAWLGIKEAEEEHYV
jgi:hypothetical protein